jgi:hypothetical protein
MVAYTFVLTKILWEFKSVKSRRMRWAGHVAHMGQRENCATFMWESLKKRDFLDDQVVDGRTGSRWRLAGRILSGFNWLRLAASGKLL